MPFAAIEKLTEAATRSGCEIEWSPPEGGTIRVRPALTIPVTESAPVAAPAPTPITPEVRERSLEAMAAERDRMQYGASRFGSGGALPMGARR